MKKNSRDILILKECPLCNSKNIKNIFKLSDAPLEDKFSKNIELAVIEKKYPLSLKICNVCSVIFLKELVNKNLSYENYTYTTNLTSGLKDHYKNYVKQINEIDKLSKNSFIIDIGSNDGTFLKNFLKYKSKVLGVEPSKKISLIAKKNNIQTINKYFDSTTALAIKNNYPSPSIITSNYTFANITNVNIFLRNVKKIINNNTILIIETGYHPKQFKKYMFDYIYHEHFLYFSLKSLILLLKKYNLTVFDVKITKPKGGSIRIYSSQNRNIKISSNIKKILKIEEKENIYKSIQYKIFFKNLMKKKNNLLNLLDKLKNNNKNIVGFGASHSTTTLIYNFDLRKYMDFIIDNNKSKYNTFSPGYGLPIFSTTILKKTKVDYIIILAWQHAEIIIKKNKKLINHKTKFIVPLPNLKII